MRDFKEKHVFPVFEGIKDIPRIKELDYETGLEFIVSSQEDVLDKLIKENDVIVVGGAFFGDEGKGKTVAANANHPLIELIFRANSGPNAGHTFYFNGQKYVVHLLPSGILTAKPNLIGPNCVMDPVSFMEDEIKKLIDNNIEYSNLIIGNVQIITPYHKLIDALGRANSSTLKGMSPVHSSKVTKKGLRLDDLFNSPDNQRLIIKRDIEIYNALLKYRGKNESDILEMCNEFNEKVPGRIPGHVIEFLDAGKKVESKIEYLVELYKKNVKENTAFPARGDVIWMVQKALKAKSKILLESAQSYYLSNNVVDHWGSSTSADTTSAGTKANTLYNQEKYKSVTINVHKTPSSRVGIGENPSGYVKQDFFSRKNIETLKELGSACDNFDAIQRQFFNSIKKNGVIEPTIYKDDFGEYTIGAAMAIASSKKHKEAGATTFKPRICGFFDCVAHYKVNESQGPYLTISGLDRLNPYDKIGLVIAYTVFNPTKELLDSNGTKYPNNSLIRPGDPMPCENVLKYCYPIIKVMEGWKRNPIETGTLKKGYELPRQANNFLANIEHYTGAKIMSFGDGPETENLVYIQRK